MQKWYVTVAERLDPWIEAGIPGIPRQDLELICPALLLHSFISASGNSPVQVIGPFRWRYQPIFAMYAIYLQAHSSIRIAHLLDCRSVTVFGYETSHREICRLSSVRNIGKIHT
jgi:hypothetical protein